MIDHIDRKILSLLQHDSSRSIAEIAERVGITQTPCWKRIRKLEDNGVVRRRVALLDATKVGAPLVGFVRIKAPRHTQDWVESFARGVAAIPEVMECHRMSGEIDYLLKIAVADMTAYDAVYKKLIKVADMSDVVVNFSMERLKDTTELPLDNLKTR